MSPKDTVLVVDDDHRNLEIVRDFLLKMGLKVLTACDGVSGIMTIREQAPDIVITDLDMPGVNGIGVIKEAKSFNPEITAMIMTGYASVASAVDAMKEGAADYIEKPINFDYLAIVVHKALDRKKLITENRTLRAKLGDRCKFHNIIGRSAPMKDIFARIEKVSPTDACVFINGETGSGKELIARAVHAYSKRSAKPFVAVDCVSLPDNLIESELFGHEKGAFTGANVRRPGLMETAQGGTFFMDEITELNYELQGKLLRTLQERQLRRVGSRETIDLDIRIIAATNRDPMQAVKEGIFREDLYYRLNVIPISLPSLRERRDDIPLLVNFFLKNNRIGGPETPRGITSKALDKLLAYNWPGNVRQLKNVIERSSILAEGHLVELHNLPDEILSDNGTASTKENGHSENHDWMTALPFKAAKDRWIEQFERIYLESILKKNKGNISKAAQASEVNRKTFHRLISKHKIDKQALLEEST